VHINRKRQSDSQSALDAQSGTQEAKPTRRAFHRYSLQRWALACFGVLGTGALLTLAACPANLEDPQRFDVPGALSSGGAAPSGGAAGAGMMPTGVDLTCVTPLFLNTCATSVACHVAGSITGLDLVTAPIEKSLVNVPAKHMLVTVTDCPAVKLVDTTTPMKSWLLSKITAGAFGDCGAQMPLGATAAAPLIMPADVACITKFVNDEAAAANGGTPPAAGGAPAAAGGAAAGGAATSTGGAGGAVTGTGGAATAGSGGM
jgi:hypothetical protein